MYNSIKIFKISLGYIQSKAPSSIYSSMRNNNCNPFHVHDKWCPDNCPRIIAPRTIVPWMIAPWIIAPRAIVPEDTCPRKLCSLGQLPLRIIAPEDKCPPEDCPLSIKFPPKITAPTQVNSAQKVLRVN